ncbi:MAG: hypothetical protein JXP34_05425 [Planctomycetes bacterium]|nr:hypothetical protein [Planctomycetota bacterium]
MLESLSPEELQFIKAIEKYKSEHNKHFLSWTEVLRVVKDLGYQRVLRRDAAEPALRRRTSQRKTKAERLS